MAAPVINNIVSVAQGTGSPLPLESVIAVRVNFTGAAANFIIELSTDDGVTWNQTITHSTATGQNVAISSNALILVVVADTFALNALSGGGAGTLTPGYGNARIRVKAINASTNEASGYTASAAFTLKSTRPAVQAMTMAQYVGSVPGATPMQIIANDTNSSGTTVPPTTFRASLTASSLQPGGAAAFQSFGSSTTANLTFNFGTEPEGANKTVYARTYDQFYNASDLASVTTYLRRTAPTNVLVRLTGSSGNASYTGIKINADGTFSPDRSVRMQVSANSPIPMSFRFEVTSDLEATTTGGNPSVSTALGNTITYVAANLIQTGRVTTNKSSPSTNDYNTDQTCSITLRVSDAAGNSSTITKQIRLNTRIYKTAHKPLWPSDSTYDHTLRYVSTGGAEVLVPRTLILGNLITRAWPDIFYPKTHGYPVDQTTGDVATAIVLADANLSNEIATDEYDPVQIETVNNVKQVKRDSDGRPIVANWTTSGAKNYQNLESSNVGNLRYWIIDNTKYGDFQLAFERFDLDTGSYGPPYNPLANYRGDVLVVYAADAAGAVQTAVDGDGNEYLELADPTLLTEIMAFGGNGSNVVNKKTGQRMNSGQNGEFVTDTIRNIKRVCMILYTDVNVTRSGFKLKSGPSHQQIWTNYDIDEVNGEIWVHMHNTISNTAVIGASETTTKRLTYDYKDQNISVDHETGTITFPAAVTGNVTLDATYLTMVDPGVLTYATTHDDFVNYNEVALYVMPAGQSVITSTIKDKIYEIDGYGRMMQHHTWDKERGIVRFDAGFFPSGRRLYADYYHHTFVRLTNDGHGDLDWHDTVLVADETPVYPDYTWRDIKISNEGDALLEDMKIKFVPRGYDTDNNGQVILDGNPATTVDQVLDITRPWDIQRGTRQETYERMAMGINSHFIWNPLCTKYGGDGFTGNSGATAILGAWRDRVYGDLSPRSVAFARAVWSLGDTGGTNYPATSSGAKRTSFEATGKYYSVLIV